MSKVGTIENIFFSHSFLASRDLDIKKFLIIAFTFLFLNWIEFRFHVIEHLGLYFWGSKNVVLKNNNFRWPKMWPKILIIFLSCIAKENITVSIVEKITLYWPNLVIYFFDINLFSKIKTVSPKMSAQTYFFKWKWGGSILFFFIHPR